MDSENQMMRLGIIAHSLPHAIEMDAQLRDLSSCDISILLCRAPGDSLMSDLIKHVGRLLLRPGGWRSISAIIAGKVKFFRKPLDARASIKKLERLTLDVGLHKSGIIYRQPTIDAFRLGILNAHIGILPQYRGRNVMEWALIEGAPVGISVFFVDTGIDTGERIVVSDEVDISHCKSVAEAKRYLFDLDALYFTKAIETLRQPDPQFGLNDGSGRRYYVMSKLFQDVVEEILKS